MRLCGRDGTISAILSGLFRAGRPIHTKMGTRNMSRINPPYRADVVGSFLRTNAVKRARADFAAGVITRDELTAVEDREIADLVRKEKQNGLVAVTDGEFRRSFWHLDFIAALSGIKHIKAEA